ncbi:hypothetical protein [Helicobacter heilmannii]|uniref:hypothetical protein n=1 Tax=Helicobacter heilmannii TaxID=35817 RepID=UPI0022393906|nr:hypothetical protein [Helicobacter heilmannii]
MDQKLQEELQDYFRVVHHLVENFYFQLSKIPGFFNLLDFVSGVFNSEHRAKGITRNQ